MNSACAEGNRETDRRRDVPIDGLVAGKAPACILGLLPAHLVRRSWSMHEAGLLTRGSNVRSAFPAFASGIGKNLPLTVARAVPELVCLADRTGFPFHPRKAEPHAAATLSAKEPRRNRERRLRERTADAQLTCRNTQRFAKATIRASDEESALTVACPAAREVDLSRLREVLQTALATGGRLQPPAKFTPPGCGAKRTSRLSVTPA